MHRRTARTLALAASTLLDHDRNQVRHIAVDHRCHHHGDTREAFPQAALQDVVVFPLDQEPEAVPGLPQRDRKRERLPLHAPLFLHVADYQ